MLKRDYVGKTVVLKRDLQNKSGVFPAGTRMIVDSTYRGRFSLKTLEECQQCQCRGWSRITKVSEDAFKLVEWNQK